MRSTSRLLCGLLVFCVTLYCESFNALVEAHARPISRQRAAKLDVRNSLKRWDRPFGAVLRGAEAVGYHNDGQLSTRHLTNAAAVVTDSYTYDAFGVTLAQTGSTANNYLYTGEQLDPNVGLYYLRTRYLNQSVGRLVSADPFPGLEQDPSGLHKYLYTAVDPVNKIDPSGQTPLIAILGVVGRFLLANLTAAFIGGYFAMIGTLLIDPEATLRTLLLSFAGGFAVGALTGGLGGFLRLRVFGDLTKQLSRVYSGTLTGMLSGGLGNFFGQVIGNINLSRNPLQNIDVNEIIESGIYGALGGAGSALFRSIPRALGAFAGTSNIATRTAVKEILEALAGGFASLLADKLLRSPKDAAAALSSFDLRAQAYLEKFVAQLPPVPE